MWFVPDPGLKMETWIHTFGHASNPDPSSSRLKGIDISPGWGRVRRTGREGRGGGGWGGETEVVLCKWRRTVTGGRENMRVHVSRLHFMNPFQIFTPSRHVVIYTWQYVRAKCVCRCVSVNVQTFKSQQRRRKKPPLKYYSVVFFV